MSHPITVNIQVHDGAIPAAYPAGRWLDLNPDLAGPVIFPPDDPKAAIAYLDALSHAAAQLRDVIAEDAMLGTVNRTT